MIIVKLDKMVVMKFFMCFVLVVLTVYAAVADDSVFATNAGGDIQSLISESYSLSFYFFETSAAQSGGNNRDNYIRYYDVLVDVNDAEYVPGQELDAVLTIKLFGDTSQQDGKLKYTLVSPDDTVLPEKIEQFAEGSYEKKISYTIPSNAVAGLWSLRVSWEVPGLEPIVATDVFNVLADWLFFIIMVCVLGSVITYFMIMQRRREI